MTGSDIQRLLDELRAEHPDVDWDAPMGATAAFVLGLLTDIALYGCPYCAGTDGHVPGRDCAEPANVPENDEAPAPKGGQK